MNNERLEELAALHALGLLDGASQNELRDAARRDQEVNDLMRDFDETASLMVHDAPSNEPPPSLKKDLMRRLPARHASPLVAFSQWAPYAIAACLMVLGIVQSLQIAGLRSQMQNLQSAYFAESATATRLQQSNDMLGLRIASLQMADGAKMDTAFAASKIMVAWDPHQNRGMLEMQNLPSPPPGHDYQLWVLDPKAQAPISAGLISGSRAFAVKPVSMSDPGFAISLEPAGGMPTPTGPILFAVAPGQ
jgi:anti-sigma-K factor RskA